MTGFDAPGDFRASYLGEVEELLAAANAQLLAVDASLRKGESNPRAVRELFRALHTVKGLSAMVGLEAIVAVTHRMEGVLRAGDRAQGRLPLPAIDVLLRGVRMVEQQVDAYANDAPVPATAPSLLDALDALEPSAVPAPASDAVALELDPVVARSLAAFEVEELTRGVKEGRRAARVDFVPSAERAAAGLTITTVRERVGAIAEIVKVVPVSVPATEAAPGGIAFALVVLTTASDDALAEAAGVPAATVRMVAAARAPAADAPEALPADLGEPDGRDLDAQRRGAVRVAVGRLDESMEALAALVVARARLGRELAALAARGVDVRELALALQDDGRRVRDLRASILRLRMVPVAEGWERLHLVVRGLRRANGKLVHLDVDAGQVECDKAVAEQLFPAIVHLVRNAVDHAVETPADRRLAGKPEEAVVRVSCVARTSAQLEVVVSDDGRGVDGAAVAKRAGREAPGSDAALLELLCLPGLSTQSAASTVSGRGMGMDIVRRIVVEDLGGELVLRTSPGAGTSFTLRVPLTLAVLDAFAFECVGQRYVAALSSVDEILEIDPSRVSYAPSPREQGARASVGMIERRGETIPLVDLDRALGSGGRREPALRALVVRRDGEAMAFGIDRMLGQQEVVVRPLADPLLRVPGVSGATDLGDGSPTLVLDLLALRGRAFARPRRGGEGGVT